MMIYRDTNLSRNKTQSCMTCHHPMAGFADPENMLDPLYSVVSIGDDGVSEGKRNAPTAAYAGFSPALQMDATGTYFGGMFWAGRATGLTADLHDPLAEQAQGPFLNEAEMNMPSVKAVVDVVRTSMYRDLFLQVFGSGSLSAKNTEQAFDNMARAIAAFERSTHVQRFTSRYDSNQLTGQEEAGLALVETHCTQCHAMETGANKGPLFTNYSYANIGVPINPLLKDNPEDLGLGGFLASSSEDGKFKVPTLRNVALTAPYSHNGYFSTLKDIVNFKNTRDVGTWNAPEVSANLINADGSLGFIGNLGLSDDEVDAIVAFLMALTDSHANM